MSTYRPPRESVDSFKDRKWKESVARSLDASLAGGIPTTVPVITTAANGDAPQSRTLTGSSNVSVTDNGAGNSVVVDLINTSVSPGSYSSPVVTVDAKGRVTAISNGSDNFLGNTFETVSKNLKGYNATYNYTGDQLTSIDYSYGAGITKTFNYTGDQLDSIVLSGDTPSGINLTKTLGYTGDVVTSVTYT